MHRASFGALIILYHHVLQFFSYFLPLKERRKTKGDIVGDTHDFRMSRWTKSYLARTAGRGHPSVDDGWPALWLVGAGGRGTPLRGQAPLRGQTQAPFDGEKT
jgi:hypothetical protein